MEAIGEALAGLLALSMGWIGISAIVLLVQVIRRR